MINATAVIGSSTLQTLERTIATKDVSSIVRLMFDRNDTPIVKSGFRTESDLWGYKSDVPYTGTQSENAWAYIAADLLAFYNAKGGILIIRDRDVGQLHFCGRCAQIRWEDF